MEVNHHQLLFRTDAIIETNIKIQSHTDLFLTLLEQ